MTSIAVLSRQCCLLEQERRPCSECGYFATEDHSHTSERRRAPSSAIPLSKLFHPKPSKSFGMTCVLTEYVLISFLSSQDALESKGMSKVSEATHGDNFDSLHSTVGLEKQPVNVFRVPESWLQAGKISLKVNLNTGRRPWTSTTGSTIRPMSPT